jgi:hypothetical protein
MKKKRMLALLVRCFSKFTQHPSYLEANAFWLSKFSQRTRKTYVNKGAKKRFIQMPQEQGKPPVFLFMPSKMGHNKGCKTTKQLFRLSKPKLTQPCHRSYLKALGLV